MMIRLHNMIVMSWNVDHLWRLYFATIFRIHPSLRYIKLYLISNFKIKHVFFVFLKNPLTFGYSVNIFKKILKKYPRDRNYVTSS